jgi:undecaprenyl-diphosphatase
VSQLPELVVAIILGLVEGATEFLPVSSTGHLIVTGAVLQFNDARAATFEVVIQLGAILAVVWHYRVSLMAMVRGFFEPGDERRLVYTLVLAFLPAAIIGLLAHDYIKSVLFTPTVVGWALIAGGFVMLVIEWWKPPTTAESVQQVGPRQALVIGFAQVLSMIPGTSRAAATILGGYGAGLSRSAATEFSFLLAIPTIVGAATLDGYKNRELLVGADLPLFALGTAVAFVSALLVIRGFLRFIENHTFSGFAWYRIAFGTLVLVLVSRGMLGQ